MSDAADSRSPLSNVAQPSGTSGHCEQSVPLFNLKLWIVDVFFSNRTIEVAHARIADILWCHQPGVYAHAISAFIKGGPVRNATAISTTMKLDCAIVPHASRVRRH